MFEKQAIEDR